MEHPEQADLGRAWNKLAGRKIYFGHMSVGFNIVEGLRDLLREHRDLALNIVETRDPAVFKAPVFGHSRIGKNHAPLSKLEDFERILDSGVGKTVDIAFLKFCFVDVTEKTDVQQLFDRYKGTIALLQKKYPRTTFVHATVPLTTVQRGARAVVKKIIGRPLDGYGDNVKRNQYNELVRKEYPAERIYDLAAVESTLPDGTRAAFSHEGRTYYSLANAYTHDGGHLNPAGRKRAAEHLVRMLSDLVQ